MKSLRSGTAIRTPARTLPRAIPAEATVLPPALAGSPGVGGARQVRMPLASATQVARSRLGRILFLVAALCLGAPTAGADAATPLDNNLAALWTTILQTPTGQNPFGTGGPASGCFDLGGTLAPFGPAGVGRCKVKEAGTKIFVAASSAECSTFEGTIEEELEACAKTESDKLGVPIVTVDGRSVLVTEVQTVQLNIVLPKHNVFGLPAETQGQSVGHGWVALLDPLTPGTHEIHIVSTHIDGNVSDITTEIDVKPGRR